MADSSITFVTGRAVPVRGNDIDTDRIIPARYLRCVTFEGLEQHAFEDDRRDLAGKVTGDHRFDNAAYAGASVLLANANFGCGSSREHAPQALGRWGIKVFVGESFAEIFFGNCIALGIPCVTVSREDAEKLLAHAEQNPDDELRIDVKSGEVSTPSFSVSGSIPEGVRDAFLRGSWDATGLLLEKPEDVQAVAAKLPYSSSFVS